jgi:hypothetical protein
MSELIAAIDRLKVVEGVVLITSVEIGERVGGYWAPFVTVGFALALFLPYRWWRKGSTFRK